jgi:putative ATP-dependent endonuclease of OLD family
MSYLQRQAEKLGVQIIITTHSPNLASTIDLNNIVMLEGGNAFSLDKDKTKLARSDYRFLARFLDVTKANLFFARGVMIVEGDAENVLLPIIAKLVSCDFTSYGVSIVNVGGVGLSRYAKIFQRHDESEKLDIPVACLTDLDVMPNCAPEIIGKVKKGEELPSKSDRQWRAKCDFPKDELKQHSTKIRNKASGQSVETFIADEWTMEYDLAYFGFADEVYIAAHLAKMDAKFTLQGNDFTYPHILNETVNAKKKLEDLKLTIKNLGICPVENCIRYKEHLASHVYSMFTKGTKASKPMAAQYLANILEEKPVVTNWQNLFPPYLVQAIHYVTKKEHSINTIAP